MDYVNFKSSVWFITEDNFFLCLIIDIFLQIWGQIIQPNKKNVQLNTVIVDSVLQPCRCVYSAPFYCFFNNYRLCFHKSKIPSNGRLMWFPSQTCPFNTISSQCPSGKCSNLHGLLIAFVTQRQNNGMLSLAQKLT